MDGNHTVCLCVLLWNVFENKTMLVNVRKRGGWNGIELSRIQRFGSELKNIIVPYPNPSKSRNATQHNIISSSNRNLHIKIWKIFIIKMIGWIYLIYKRWEWIKFMIEFRANWLAGWMTDKLLLYSVIHSIFSYIHIY